MTVIEFSLRTSGRLLRDTLKDLIAACEAALAIRVSKEAAGVPDPEYNTADEAVDAAMSNVVGYLCTPDEFVEKLEYIYACCHDVAGPPRAGDDYGTLALAVEAYLEQLPA
jgi:hypothetical protein